MRALASINHWIHLTSVVIWVGSLAFIVMTLTPAMRGKFPQESTKVFFEDIRRRYFRMSGILLALILVTGGINVHFALQNMERASKLWVIFLGIKLALVTGFASIYLLNVLYKSNPPEPGEEIVPYSSISLMLGFLIILCAAFLRYLH
jgi:putative copper export protein